MARITFRPTESQLDKWLLDSKTISWIKAQINNRLSESSIEDALQTLIQRLLKFNGDESVACSGQFSFGVDTSTWELWVINYRFHIMTSADYPVKLTDTIETTDTPKRNLSPQQMAKRQKRMSQHKKNRRK